MPLPVLTWNISTEQQIAATVPTYAQFINKIESMVTASTHWRVNAKNLDAGNSRGWIELATKSALAGVAEGRVLILYSTGTVAGTDGTEVPRKAARQIPWDTEDTSLACTMWAAFSPNANTALNVGPATSPWTTTTPYGSAYWSKLCPLNVGIPDAASTMQIIESAEGIALLWYPAISAQTQGIIAGRLLEDIGGETANWMLSGIFGQSTGVYNATAWSTIATSTDYPPLGSASSAYNSNSSPKSWTFTIDTSGLLTGCGRANPEAFTGIQQNAGLASATQAAFTTIVMGGGAYGASQKDALVGIMRQVRWGPPAYRGQRLYAGSPVVEQGIHLNYATPATGAKVGGLWFDNFR